MFTFTVAPATAHFVTMLDTNKSKLHDCRQCSKILAIGKPYHHTFPSDAFGYFPTKGPDLSRFGGTVPPFVFSIFTRDPNSTSHVVFFIAIAFGVASSMIGVIGSEGLFTLMYTYNQYSWTSH